MSTIYRMQMILPFSQKTFISKRIEKENKRKILKEKDYNKKKRKSYYLDIFTHICSGDIFSR